MKAINSKAQMLVSKASTQVMPIFKLYGDKIYNKDETIRLVNLFAMTSSDSIAELTTELESVINHELVENSEQILLDYQKKLEKIDESVADAQLDFATTDLIQGELAKMKENAKAWGSDEFVSDTLEEVGVVEYEERSFYEKIGEEEEEIIVGSHEEKIGTKKVKTGSHKEWTGTRTVKNPKKKWWKIFTPAYIEEDVYKEVDDYKDEDVYKTVMDYKTIMRDVYEERTETIEKFSADVSTLQAGLLTTLVQNLESGTNAMCSNAEAQVNKMKERFIESLERLDKLITQKYVELEQCVKDRESREKELEKSKEILGWIEACKLEMDKILDM